MHRAGVIQKQIISERILKAGSKLTQKSRRLNLNRRKQAAGFLKNAAALRDRVDTAYLR